MESVLTHVPSSDGTAIGVFVSGTGRPLVVVPGTTSDHTAWRLVVPLLEPHATIYGVDRRGRGASGDGTDYSLALEHDDVAAVVDAAAAANGGPVDLLGHSYGGNVAWGAVPRTTNVRKLVLYEGWPTPDPHHRLVAPDVLARLDRLLAENRRDDLLETMYREIVQMSEEEVAEIKGSPTWPARLANAHTVPRELTAFSEQAFVPSQAAEIRVPVLLLVGESSPVEIAADPAIVADALPDARVRVLPGQGHIAHVTDPSTFAAEVLAFLSG